MTRALEEAAIACRFALGTIFLLSGTAKLFNWAEFEQVVLQYRAVPEAMSRLVARVLPPLEMAAALCLLLGVLTRAAAFLGALLLVAFAGAIGLNLVRGRRVACGCFGTLSSREVSWVAVFRNIVLAAAALFVVANVPAAVSLDHRIGLQTTLHGPSTGDAVAMLIAGTLAAFVLLLAEEGAHVGAVTRSLGRTLSTQ